MKNYLNPTKYKTLFPIQLFWSIIPFEQQTGGHSRQKELKYDVLSGTLVPCLLSL